MAVGLGTLTLNLIAQTGLFTQGLNRAEQQTRTSARNMSNELNLVGRTFKDLQGTLMASFAGALTIGTAIAKMDAYTGLQNRLKLVTASQVELNQALKDTFNIAQATGQSWDSTAQVYQRFADNAKRLGITLQDASSLTDTVSKSIAISGASAASAEAALVQFSQALASGVLRGEEFNSISEQAPGLLKAIATGLDTNIGQLRKMAAEGQLTADVVIKSLEKAKVSVDDLFGKTDFTIANSFTMLNNAVIQFVGEAGKGSGAAQVLSGSIKALADNLDVLTNAAMVGAAFYAGTFIPAIYGSVTAGYAKTKQLIEQTAVQYATINAERAAAAQALASAQATAVNTQATLAALAAEKALEVERLKAQINQAGRIATATRMAQLRRIEVQVTAELTAAETALAAARTRSTAAATMSTRVGAGLLGVLGGPVGLGLTVAGVAASYLIMQDNADKVNKKLIEQASVADKASSELNKLQGVERKSAINDLTEAFAAQNDELKKSGFAVSAALIDIQNYEKGNWKVVEVINQANKGTISYNDAIKKLNDMKISSDLYNALKKQVEQYDANFEKASKSATALKIFGKTVVLTGNDAQNAALQQQKHVDSLNDSATAADKANDALTKYRDKLKENAFSGLYKQGLLEQGYSPSQAGAIFDLQQARGMSAILSKDEISSALNVLRITEQTAKAEQAYNDRIKQSSGALKKAADEAKRRQEEQKRLEKEQAQSRDQISFEYADDFTRMNIDYQKQVAEINKANFGSEQSKYLEAAKARYDFNTEMYLRQITEENDSFRWSEEYKLRYFDATQREIIENSGKYNEDIKQLKLNSLKDQTEQELAWLELEKQQRLLESRQFYMSDSEYMQERYQLEREEIAKNLKLTQEERDARIAMNLAEEEYEKRKNLKSASMAWGQSYADMTGSGVRFQIEQDRFNRYEESQALFDSQMALAETAAEREAIWQAHNERMRIIDENYWNSTKAYQLGMAADVFGGLSGVMLNFVDESSSSYRALVAIQKGANLASVLMNSITAISAAWASSPFPYNLPAVAMATVETGALQATLQAFTPQGFANGGYTGAGGKYDPAGIVHKGEVVFSQADVARWGGVGNVEALRTGKGFADGGVVDTKVLDMANNQAISGYLSDRQTANEQASSQQSQPLNMSVNNFVDWDSGVPEAMATPAGTKVFMNMIKREKTKINALLGRA
ncbi:tape measure protein [Acinetobacter sp. Tr-809]|uniref:tape measure protein n=1 Tax=Acinetobacter sp. Tr-809 TaxID=2608324 RepID=UPI001C09B7BB|nr:tape measure protein [Acinetobacter sp. Tr-809]NIE95192.1 tape measure protein [Acinetobacter sp. Tr-809]